MTSDEIKSSPLIELFTDKIPQKLYLIWIIFIGTIKTLLPYSWLKKKSVVGKNVLITGGGNGIGRLMSLRMAELNARVIIWDINEKGSQEVAKECKALSRYEPLVYVVNLADKDTVYETAKKTLEQVGVVDILINNAGIVNGGPFLTLPDEKKELVMTVNAISHWWTIKAFLPKMIEQRSGHIVTIASCAGLLGCSELVDYCSSKFAAVGTHEAITAELDAMGCGPSQGQIFTTVVCPSFIDTPMCKGAKSASTMLPMLQSEYVSNTIVDAILTNQIMLCLPKTAYMLNILKSILPASAMLYANALLGVNETVSAFTGRADKKN